MLTSREAWLSAACVAIHEDVLCPDSQECIAAPIRIYGRPFRKQLRCCFSRIKNNDGGTEKAQVDNIRICNDACRVNGLLSLYSGKITYRIRGPTARTSTIRDHCEGYPIRSQ